MTTIESGTAIGIEYIASETRAVAIHEAGHAAAGARLHEGRRVDPPLDPHARRLARTSPGTREGRALQPFPLGRDGTAGLDARRDGGRTGLLRRELERGRRRRAIRDRSGGVDGRRVRDGPRAVRGDAARRRDRRRRPAARAEALREDRRPDHESNERRWAFRRESDRRRPRRPRQATARGADPRPGVCLGLQPDPAQQGRGREDRGQARGAPRGLRRRPGPDPRRRRPEEARDRSRRRRKRGRGCDFSAHAGRAGAPASARADARRPGPQDLVPAPLRDHLCRSRRGRRRGRRRVRRPCEPARASRSGSLVELGAHRQQARTRAPDRRPDPEGVQAAERRAADGDPGEPARGAPAGTAGRVDLRSSRRVSRARGRGRHRHLQRRGRGLVRALRPGNRHALRDQPREPPASSSCC